MTFYICPLWCPLGRLLLFFLAHQLPAMDIYPDIYLVFSNFQECGPRFTLKLISLQHGTFDTKGGEYEWVHKVIHVGKMMSSLYIPFQLELVLFHTSNEIRNLFMIDNKFSNPSCFFSAGDGYKSTEIFLVIMLDVSAVGISRSLYPNHV